MKIATETKEKENSMSWLDVPAEKPEREARGGEIFKIDPRRIKIHPDNIRTITPENMDEDDIWLKDDISKHGVQKEVELMKNPNYDTDGIEFLSFDGNRRMTFVFELIAEGKFPFGFVPAKLKKTTSDENALVAMFRTNSGKPLKEIEKAIGVERLIDAFQLSAQDVADKLSYKLAYVKKLYAIAKLPTAVKNMIREEKIMPSVAIEVKNSVKGDIALITALNEILSKRAAATATSPIESDSVTSDNNTPPDKAGEQKKSKKSGKITASDVSHITGKTTPIQKLEQLHDLVLGTDLERKAIENAGEPIGKAYFEVADVISFLKNKMTLDEITKTVKFGTDLK